VGVANEREPASRQLATLSRGTCGKRVRLFLVRFIAGEATYQCALPTKTACDLPFGLIDWI
jgi:hypothetical protein